MSTKKSKTLYNQLLIVENTEENRNKVKDLNKRMREYGSKWRLYSRYRKPKKGQKYGWGGSLKCENADGLGIYVKLCKEARELEVVQSTDSYKERQQERRILNNKIEKLHSIIKRISLQILPDEDWWGDDCPVCQSSEIECYKDFVDSEQWVCNSCDIEWSCNKEQRRYDLGLDI